MFSWPYLRSRCSALFVIAAALLWLQPGLAIDQQPPAGKPAITQAGQAEGQVCECEGCTSILVGKTASADGSTMTSHSCDSTTDRTWINVVPHQTHKPGEMAKVYMEPKRT